MIEHNIKLFGAFKDFGLTDTVGLWGYVRQLYKAFQDGHKEKCVLRFDGFLYMYANVLTPEVKQYKQLTTEQQHVLEMATKYWIGFAISKSRPDRNEFADRSIPVVIDKETNEGFIEVLERKIVSAGVINNGVQTLKKVTPDGDIETFGDFFEPAAQRIFKGNSRKFANVFAGVREKHINDAKADGSYAEWEQHIEALRQVDDTKTRMALLQAMSRLTDSLSGYKELLLNKEETLELYTQVYCDISETIRRIDAHMMKATASQKPQGNNNQ